jgi:hypothetical protein
MDPQHCILEFLHFNEANYYFGSMSCLLYLSGVGGGEYREKGRGEGREVGRR